MSLLTVLENLTIGPLKLVFETIFSIAYRTSENPGFAIIILSLVMNILVLPLYRRADAMQEQARDTEAKLHKGVAHIKKAFSGDERMMILQTYYRENHYRPTDALNGSVSLLLEIPFFMAAYQFLSNVEVLNTTVFGPIRDLGAPDGLLVIGDLTINLLPILMTAINCISSALYLKGFPLKTKIQLYGMALFFLVFLYNSPSGLVFYWTLNNLFSLVKTIFYKLRNPRKVLCWLGFSLGLPLAGFSLFLYHPDSRKLKVFLILLDLMLMLPLGLYSLRSRVSIFRRNPRPHPQSNPRVFWLGALFLTVLTGVLIPSAVIAASPQEFVDINWFYHPLWYIAHSLCFAAGTFLVWTGVFYWLADSRWKVYFQQLVWILCGVMLMNYLFFGTKLGMITIFLQYEDGLHFSGTEQLINLLAIAAVSAILYLVIRKYARSVTLILMTALVAIGSMSAVNMVQIKKSVDQVLVGEYRAPTLLSLSKTGKNVIVLMLDRAMGEYIPYLFNEKPELCEQFDGFTYYPNTISFGGCTNLAIPALLGGYEYTPVEMNKRSDEPLVAKHNEALKVMPTLFADEGYQVTVCDPTYANYQTIPDLSIFDDPRIQSYITIGTMMDDDVKTDRFESNRRNFFLFGVMKAMPLFLQRTIYDGASYNHIYIGPPRIQTASSSAQAEGIPFGFLVNHSVLDNLPYITSASDDETNTFLFMTNDITHEPALLQEPDYVPSQIVDNTAYDAANKDRFTVNGRTLTMETPDQYSHYQTNMAAMLLLGKWFDYLRENDIYDNTRIILVSDHGRGGGHLEDMVIPLDIGNLFLEFYFPLLMVKDFDSHGFTTSEEFMTNADVPTLATTDLIENPINPFTGKNISNAEKTAHDQIITLSYVWELQKNCGNTFLPSCWASVSGNPWDLNNWSFYQQECVLDHHSLP